MPICDVCLHVCTRPCTTFIYIPASPRVCKIESQGYSTPRYQPPGPLVGSDTFLRAQRLRAGTRIAIILSIATPWVGVNLRRRLVERRECTLIEITTMRNTARGWHTRRYLDGYIVRRPGIIGILSLNGTLCLLCLALFVLIFQRLLNTL